MPSISHYPPPLQADANSTYWKHTRAVDEDARGDCDSSRCASNAGLSVARPKVLYDAPRERYVMWMGVDDAVEADVGAASGTLGRDLALAGVATSAHPNGPFLFRRALYPDGNRTKDQARPFCLVVVTVVRCVLCIRHARLAVGLGGGGSGRSHQRLSRHTGSCSDLQRASIRCQTRALTH